MASANRYKTRGMLGKLNIGISYKISSTLARKTERIQQYGFMAMQFETFLDGTGSSVVSSAGAAG